MTRRIASVILVAFIANTLLGPANAWAQSAPSFILNLPAPGVMVRTTPEFTPPIFRGLVIHPDAPFKFDFILDNGSTALANDELKTESTKLIKYFLASLTLPETDLWVNLSPYEKNRIMADEFGATDMGRDMLAQDYLLKQLTASLIYPEDELGKKFWDRVYEKAQAQYGTTQIPVNTFNKVWIVPGHALVYENKDRVFLLESRLKVMLDEDYVALNKTLESATLRAQRGASTGEKQESATPGAQPGASTKADTSKLSSDIIREIIIPEIEKEVNEGKNFAQLRQIYHSLILATWYKKNLHNSILHQAYADQRKVEGIETADKDIKQKIYAQYLAAFKKGVYSFIREDYDEAQKAMVPRKYFSGGIRVNGDHAATASLSVLNSRFKPVGALTHVTGEFKSSRDAAMLASEPAQPQGVGLIFGKFAPFHNGHEMMVRQALKQTDHLILLLYEHPELTDIPAAEMAQLIRQIINDPKLEVRVAANAPPPGDSAEARKAHMTFMRAQLPAGVTVTKVFNNEWYGQDIARSLGAELVQVDPQRTQHPVSATDIRKDPRAHLSDMHPLMAERVLRAKMVPAADQDARFREKIDASFLETPLTSAEKDAIKQKTLDLNPGYDPQKLTNMLKWDVTRFQRPNLPAAIARLDDPQAFSTQKGMRILDMAIRMPGQGWAIPKELEQFRETIQRAVEFERSVNPDFDSYYVYITVDQKKVDPQKSQRRTGYHSDAYVTQENTVDVEEKLADNTYVIYDKLPTLFQPGPFSFAGVDPEDDQAVLRHFDESTRGKDPVTYPAHTLLKLTPFDVHTPDVNTSAQTMERTFVKISFSKERYNLIGNQINPLLRYDGWTWMPRNLAARNHRNRIADWDREDKDQFQLIDPATVDFSKDEVSVDWAKPKFIWAKKTEGVRAQRANSGEMLFTTVNGFVVTVNLAQEGDWKITTSQGDQYFLSDKKLRNRYSPEPDAQGIYQPIGQVMKMLEITQPIRLRSSWGAMQYASPGSVLVYVDDGNGKGHAYAVHKDNFDASYSRTDAQGNILPFYKTMAADRVMRPLATDQRENLRKDLLTLNPAQDPRRVVEVQPWDIREFDKPHLPVVIGSLKNTAGFSQYDDKNKIRVLDMAVHVPGQGWAIPKELEQFREAIEMAVAAERLANPDFDRRFVHITVDQKIVAMDQPGRRPGLHTDVGLTDEAGNQLDVVAANKKYIALKRGPSDHAYVVHDALPTEFYPGPFPLANLPDDNTMTFEEMAKGQTPVTYPNHTMLRLNAYDIHTSVLNKTGAPQQRTFLKIQFTSRLLDRPMNTANPNFDYEQARAASQKFLIPAGAEETFRKFQDYLQGLENFTLGESEIPYAPRLMPMPWQNFVDNADEPVFVWQQNTVTFNWRKLTGLSVPEQEEIWWRAMAQWYEARMGEHWGRAAGDGKNSFYQPDGVTARLNGVRKALETIGVNAHGKIALDAGTGDGVGAMILAAQGASRVVGIDSSANSIKLAKKNVADQQWPIEFRVQGITGLAGSQEQFDIIFVRHLFSFLPDPMIKHFLGILRQRLSPGGTLVVHEYPSWGKARGQNMDWTGLLTSAGLTGVEVKEIPGIDAKTPRGVVIKGTVPSVSDRAMLSSEDKAKGKKPSVETSVRFLDLSELRGQAQVFQSLETAGIKTIKDLLGRSSTDLEKLPFIREATVWRIKAALLDLNGEWYLADDADAMAEAAAGDGKTALATADNGTPAGAPIKPVAPSPIRKPLTLSSDIRELEISKSFPRGAVMAYALLEENGIRTVHDLLQVDQGELDITYHLKPGVIKEIDRKLRALSAGRWRLSPRREKMAVVNPARLKALEPNLPLFKKILDGQGQLVPLAAVPALRAMWTKVTAEFKKISSLRTLEEKLYEIFFLTGGDLTLMVAVFGNQTRVDEFFSGIEGRLQRDLDDLLAMAQIIVAGDKFKLSDQEYFSLQDKYADLIRSVELAGKSPESWLKEDLAVAGKAPAETLAEILKHQDTLDEYFARYPDEDFLPEKPSAAAAAGSAQVPESFVTPAFIGIFNDADGARTQARLLAWWKDRSTAARPDTERFFAPLRQAGRISYTRSLVDLHGTLQAIRERGQVGDWFHYRLQSGQYLFARVMKKGERQEDFIFENDWYLRLDKSARQRLGLKGNYLESILVDHSSLLRTSSLPEELEKSLARSGWTADQTNEFFRWAAYRAENLNFLKGLEQADVLDLAIDAGLYDLLRMARVGQVVPHLTEGTVIYSAAGLKNLNALTYLDTVKPEDLLLPGASEIWKNSPEVQTKFVLAAIFRQYLLATIVTEARLKAGRGELDPDKADQMRAWSARLPKIYAKAAQAFNEKAIPEELTRLVDWSALAVKIARGARETTWNPAVVLPELVQANHIITGFMVEDFAQNFQPTVPASEQKIRSRDAEPDADPAMLAEMKGDHSDYFGPDGKPLARYSVGVVQALLEDSPVTRYIREVQQKLKARLPEGAMTWAGIPQIVLGSGEPSSARLKDAVLESATGRFQAQAIPFGITADATSLNMDAQALSVSLKINGQPELARWLAVAQIRMNDTASRVPVAWRARELTPAEERIVQEILAEYPAEKWQGLTVALDSPVLAYSQDAIFKSLSVVARSARSAVPAEKKAARAIESFVDSYLYPLLKLRFNSKRSADFSRFKSQVQNIIAAAGVDIQEVYKRRPLFAQYLDTPPQEFDFLRTAYIVETLNREVFIPHQFLFLFTQVLSGGHALAFGQILQQDIMEIPFVDDAVVQVPAFRVKAKYNDSTYAAFFTPDRILAFEEGLDILMENLAQSGEGIAIIKAARGGEFSEQLLDRMPKFPDVAKAELLAYAQDIEPMMRTETGRAELRRRVLNDRYSHETAHWMTTYLFGRIFDSLRQIEDPRMTAIDMDSASTTAAALAQTFNLLTSSLFNKKTSDLWRQFQELKTVPEQRAFMHVAQEVLVDLRGILDSQIYFSHITHSFRRALDGPLAGEENDPLYVKADRYILEYFSRKLGFSEFDAVAKEATYRYILRHPKETRTWASELLQREFNAGGRMGFQQKAGRLAVARQTTRAEVLHQDLKTIVAMPEVRRWMDKYGITPADIDDPANRFIVMVGKNMFGSSSPEAFVNAYRAIPAVRDALSKQGIKKVIAIPYNVEEKDLPGVLEAIKEHPQVIRMTVTQPHKEAIGKSAWVNEWAPESFRIMQTTNNVNIVRDQAQPVKGRALGRAQATNSDGPSTIYAMHHIWKIDPADKTVMLIGYGGIGKAIFVSLIKDKTPPKKIIVAVRAETREKHAQELEVVLAELRKTTPALPEIEIVNTEETDAPQKNSPQLGPAMMAADIIINATPVGAFVGDQRSPVKETSLYNPRAAHVDTNYRDKDGAALASAFLRQAYAAGSRQVFNGTAIIIGDYMLQIADDVALLTRESTGKGLSADERAALEKEIFDYTNQWARQERKLGEAIELIERKDQAMLGRDAADALVKLSDEVVMVADEIFDLRQDDLGMDAFIIDNPDNRNWRTSYQETWREIRAQYPRIAALSEADAADLRRDLFAHRQVWVRASRKTSVYNLLEILRHELFQKEVMRAVAENSDLINAYRGLLEEGPIKIMVSDIFLPSSYGIPTADEFWTQWEFPSVGTAAEWRALKKAVYELSGDDSKIGDLTFRAVNAVERELKPRFNSRFATLSGEIKTKVLALRNQELKPVGKQTVEFQPVTARSRRTDKTIRLDPPVLEELVGMTALARQHDVELNAKVYLNQGRAVGVDYPHDPTRWAVIRSLSDDEFVVTESSEYFLAPVSFLAYLRSLLRQWGKAESEEAAIWEGKIVKGLQDLGAILQENNAQLELYSRDRKERYRLGSAELLKVSSMKEEAVEYLQDIAHTTTAVTTWFGAQGLGEAAGDVPEHDEVMTVHTHPNRNPSPPSAIVNQGVKLGDVYTRGFFSGQVMGIIMDTAEGDRLFLFHEPDATREADYIDAFNRYWYSDGDPQGLSAVAWDPGEKSFSRSQNEQAVLSTVEGHLAMDSGAVFLLAIDRAMLGAEDDLNDVWQAVQVLQAAGADDLRDFSVEERSSDETAARRLLATYPVEKLLRLFIRLSENDPQYRQVVMALQFNRSLLAYSKLRELYRFMHERPQKRKDLVNILRDIVFHVVDFDAGERARKSRINRRTWEGRLNLSLPVLDRQVEAWRARARARARGDVSLGDFAVADGTSSLELTKHFVEKGIKVRVTGYDKMFYLRTQQVGEFIVFRDVDGRLIQVVNEKSGEVYFVARLTGDELVEFEDKFGRMLKGLKANGQQEEISSVSLINPEAEEFSVEHPDLLRFKEQDVFMPIEHSHQVMRVAGLLMRGEFAYFPDDRIKQALATLGQGLDEGGTVLNGTFWDDEGVPEGEYDLFERRGRQLVLKESQGFKAQDGPVEPWQSINLSTDQAMLSRSRSFEVPVLSSMNYQFATEYDARKGGIYIHVDGQRRYFSNENDELFAVRHEAGLERLVPEDDAAMEKMLDSLIGYMLRMPGKVKSVQVDIEYKLFEVLVSVDDDEVFRISRGNPQHVFNQGKDGVSLVTEPDEANDFVRAAFAFDPELNSALSATPVNDLYRLLPWQIRLAGRFSDLDSPRRGSRKATPYRELFDFAALNSLQPYGLDLWPIYAESQQSVGKTSPDLFRNAAQTRGAEDEERIRQLVAQFANAQDEAISASRKLFRAALLRELVERNLVKEGQEMAVLDEISARVFAGGAREITREDRAMLGVAPAAADKKVGGIDFNPQQLNLQSQGPRVEINLLGPTPGQPLEIPGLIPFIHSITPVTNLPLLFGASEEKPVPSEQLSAVH